jgi:hypothetical protein
VLDVAAYAECFTDTVPIPGEPCRSDDELQQPSRIQDSFALDLQLSAPPQNEDDAIADFVRWVRRIPLVDTPPGDVDAFIEELRLLMALEASSPPSPPALIDLLDASPPPSLEIPRAAAGEYLAALFSFWVTDLRARVRSDGSGGECDCSGGPGSLDDAADSLCLAELTVPLVIDALTGSVIVADTPPITISADERSRPTLLHTKLLQEWLLSASEAAAETPDVVSGRFLADGTTVSARGGLTAHPLPLASPPSGDATVFLLTFSSYSPSAHYVVTGQTIAAAADAPASTFEVILADDPGVVGELGSPPEAGIVVRVRDGAGGAVPNGFMARIEEL